MTCPGHNVISRGGKTFPLCWTDSEGHCACGRGHSDKEAGKAPLTPNGVHDGTGDVSQVDRWQGEFPEANWAATGHTYIDIDDAELAAALKDDVALRAENFLVETPRRNGLHIHLKETAPTSTRSRILKTADGRRIGELRRDGQYVVAPGSKLAGKPYRILADNPPQQVADAENWVRGILQGFDVQLDDAGEKVGTDTDNDTGNDANDSFDGWEDVDPEAALARAVAALGSYDAARLIGILNAPENYTAKYPSISEMDFATVSMLLKAGLDKAEVVAAWRRSQLGQRRKAQFRDDYVARTLSMAWAHVGRDGKGGSGGEGIYTLSPENGNAADLLETPADMAEEGVDGEVEWHVHGLVGGGKTTLIVALPKVGKTTFVLKKVRASLDETPFIGLASKPMRLLYLTEENKPSFLQALKRAGLDSATDIKIIRRDRVRASWSDFAAQLPKLCEDNDFDVVIVDTILRWWGLPEKGENDSGTILKALEPLARLAAQGVAVVLVHHLRKMEGEEGTQAGGSRALAAAVDILVELRRSGDSPNRRVLTCYSRFDETPANLVIELGNDGYTALGDLDSVELKALKAKVLDVLPEAEEDPETRDDIAKAAGINRGQVSRALKTLDDEGLVERTGTGKRGDPYRFRKRGAGYRGSPPKTESEEEPNGTSEADDGQ